MKMYVYIYINMPIYICTPTLISTYIFLIKIVFTVM